jgi:hypothetical protein
MIGVRIENYAGKVCSIYAVLRSGSGESEIE